MTIVDTSVWIDFFRGVKSAGVHHLVGMIERDDGVGLTDVVLTELLQGVSSDREAKRLEQHLLAFEIFRLEGLDDFRRAARLYRQARSRGQIIRRTLDCLIAAVCVREDLPLLHSDSDFDRLAESTELRVASAVGP